MLQKFEGYHSQQKNFCWYAILVFEKLKKLYMLTAAGMALQLQYSDYYHNDVISYLPVTTNVTVTN